MKQKTGNVVIYLRFDTVRTSLFIYFSVVLTSRNMKLMLQVRIMWRNGYEYYIIVKNEASGCITSVSCIF